MGNLKSILSNTRSRVVLIFTVIVLLIAVVIGVSVFSRAPDKGQAITKIAPQMHSVVGGFDHPVGSDYAKLLEEQNRQKAKEALKNNGTAVPTIINAENLDTGASASPVSCTTCATVCPAVSANPSVNTPSPVEMKPAPMGTVCADGTVRDANGKIIGKTGLVAPGGLVYDKNGNVIGVVGSDGQVRDKDGNILGVLSADGTVRDANGKVIGTTTTPSGTDAAGKAVYDANGKLLGYVGADGQVRDANGKIIGSVNADGTVRDINGNVIGHTSLKPRAGSLVYDAQGHLLGTVGPDGKVRDANGKIIGTVGSDGQVRDLNGKVIGSVSSNSAIPGSAVYDSNGHLIGTVGADGKVRDAQGRVIGVVGADGKVRDPAGNVLGTVSNPPKSGSLVYGKNGQVLGTVGADGKVRDANGNVIGAVGSDGVVRDNAGNVVGNINPAGVGSAVYDSQGRFLGTVGADGRVRDANGKVIGVVGSDGVVRDAAGRPIGHTSYIAPGSAVFGSDGRLISANLGPGQKNIPGIEATPGEAETAQDKALHRQQLVQQQQKARQMTLQLQNAMSGQMSQLLAAWNPPVQQLTAGNLANGAEGASGVDANGKPTNAAGANSPANVPVLIKAGSVMLAVLDTAVNSDEPGPIMATITEGKLKGSKLLGSMTNQGKKMMLSFSTASIPGLNSSVTVNTVAIDTATARTALSSDTDNHYLLRYGTLFASSFLSGYAQALTQSGSQTTYTINGVVHTYPPLDSSQKALVALGNVGQQYGSILGNVFNTPPTVRVYAGTGIGVLFLSDMPTPAGFETASN